METESVRVPAVTDKEEKLYQADENYKASQGDVQSDDKADTKEVQKHKTQYVYDIQYSGVGRQGEVTLRSLEAVVTKHANIQVLCSHDNVNDTMADTKNRIVADTSRLIFLLGYATFIPTLFLSFFMGSYSDYLGRRILVLLSMSGNCLKALVFLVVVCLNINLHYLYLAYLLDGLFGSFNGLEMGLHAATSDTTVDIKERALIFAFLRGSFAISGVSSQISVGFLITSVGFVVPAILCCAVSVIACILVFFLMPETLQRPAQTPLNPLVHLRKVLQRCASHVTIGNLAMLSEAASFALEAFASADWMMYLTPALGVFSSSARPVVKTLMSQITPPTDKSVRLSVADLCFTGAIFSSMAAVEIVSRMSSTAIHNTLYTSTLSTFPGAVFLLLAALSIICVALLLVFQVISMREVRGHLVSTGADYGSTKKAFQTVGTTTSGADSVAGNSLLPS
ncbi:hypothetical protein C0Q70_13399 [Pomacea canaliculata]|uniref:Major facilitator superfamily (MFS) profile domain-containing protein n=1 Tax=Pomacea canaliculata TaxID=400727 RepID=A0A2T7NX62_POMCA|nr:hypothetical protein C0Q70_13399 [Pomacea canaliculata]